MSLAETSLIRLLCGSMDATFSPPSCFATGSVSPRVSKPLLPQIYVSSSSNWRVSGHPHFTGSSVELPSAGDEEEVVKHLFLEPRSRGNPGLPCPARARWRRLPRLQLSRGSWLVLPLPTQCLRLESGSRARHLQAENLTSLLWLHGQNHLGFAGGKLSLPFPSLPLPSPSAFVFSCAE